MSREHQPHSYTHQPHIDKVLAPVDFNIGSNVTMTELVCIYGNTPPLYEGCMS